MSLTTVNFVRDSQKLLSIDFSHLAALNLILPATADPRGKLYLSGIAQVHNFDNSYFPNDFIALY